MSTYQPPGEPPSYVPPQDPWANAQGVTSAPTDPIPQQAHGQFTPGVASPSVWTQETISHGDYEYVPQQRSRLGTYILVVLAVIVLGGGGGYGAYVLATNGFGGPGTGPTNGPTNSATTPNNSTSSVDPTPTIDAAAIRVNDCLLNIGTDNDPRMAKVPCTTPKSYKVVKIASGESIPEGPDGQFGEQTWDLVCAGTNPTRKVWFGWDSSDDKNDFFFCLTIN
jgi:hypothetical protein